MYRIVKYLESKLLWKLWSKISIVQIAIANQAKKEEIKYRNYMAAQTKQDRRDPAFKRQLR